MPEELTGAITRLEATLSRLDDTMAQAQLVALQAAADAKRAADIIAKERWWRRLTIVMVLLLAAAVSAGIWDTRADGERERSRLEREAERAASKEEAERKASCLRANESRGYTRTAIVGAVEELSLFDDGTIDAEELAFLHAVTERGRQDIPERDCE